LNHKADGVANSKALATRTNRKMAETAGERSTKRRRELGRCAAVWPLYLRYRGLVAGAMRASLILAAATTLTLPIAVRRMIDHGFNADSDLDRQLFLAC
jgi:hypothetical protein